MAKLFAGMLCDKNVVYAKQKVRSGPDHSDFSDTFDRYLSTTNMNNGRPYTKPIVCLQGPGAISSGEAFTLMMKALPHCTTVGLPTRGASGNPSPVTLPNGVSVWYSRWVAMDAAGVPFEDVGIQPDELVKHVEGADPAYARAIEILNESTQK